MPSREERIAENQALFRAMNQRLGSWEERRAAPQEKHMFFCECGDRRCHERVCLTITEYEAVREHALRFAVLRGHVFPEAERVVAEPDGYVVVQKHDHLRAVIDEAPHGWATAPDGAERDAG
jgi:hypothetical protein